MLTLKRRKTFRAKLVDLSTFWAVPGSPLLKNLEPYCIALHILSLVSALFKYNTTNASSALVASSVVIFYAEHSCKNEALVNFTSNWALEAYSLGVAQKENRGHMTNGEASPNQLVSEWFKWSAKWRLTQIGHVLALQA